MEPTPNGVQVGDVVLLLGSREHWTRRRTIASLLSGLPNGIFLDFPKYIPTLHVSRAGQTIAERDYASIEEAQMVRAAIAEAGPYPVEADWQAVLDHMADPE